ncbi:dsrm domain-containing protein/DEAD domain-containing protein/Helicase_C domain-containing protein/Ribonuclease_3 domain-containing protein/PAZ domain-containing protein/dsRNA_bind domain-containing protein [Cephalotus follicularis]|uniref:Dsrm domain-containing protein/DEAD domain-containing protein/Helicase_C domain-containing protein/Ribonuclease_3 domain-containing protein/PAZ domain-containing protein/dsRNA_bind domain-containin... n=1 Tax=Cephalotus follicularis TaxID=3775 RepID=A0A1Q3CUQ1_CEPFO|nr:dsrm domain-containing protein/DEAD domain-containing protein/Helicase_C domain-containing protein/Ribonuclease_3 domain-containing protein/PAZ domain-containing protein/dsRNA_bind domain-containing protein [Cephalotus follicularis]
MPDGEGTGTKTSLIMEEGSSSRAQKTEKDPRIIARSYQLELCKKALEENIIVYLGTGCGKTHIAVLLIYELGHLIRKPQKKICIFLAPTNALVQQQARVIEDSVNFKVGIFCGSSKNLKSHRDWNNEIEKYEIFVMTPQILLRSLYHCFIKMDLIALLIFDECHHAQVKSNHPYAEIMRDFYKSDVAKVPRIFGMTASPVVGKGASNDTNLPKSINSLEDLLDAKVYSVEDKDELESFIASPVVRVYHYGPASNTTSSYGTYLKKLQEMKHQCLPTFSGKTEDHQSIWSRKKFLTRMHDNIIFCLENLGLWGALQAGHILGDRSERNELIEAEGNFSDDSLCERYLAQAAEIFSYDFTRDGNSSDLSCVEVLKEPFFSKKLLRLIGILSTFRLQPDMKCIIFVSRIITARSLSYILQKLKFLASWRCHFLVGVRSGLKSMSRKSMNAILQKFRSGELNLLIATKVGEEGLDIQTCCLVIRFDLPETVASFIQSRGRARMPQSEYAFLVDSGNQKELDLIESFKKDEDRMNIEISARTSNEMFTGSEERMYKVDLSGASVSSGYSISLLHHYCAKLPHDEFFDPAPRFYYFDDLGGTFCKVIFPSNAPLHQTVSTAQSSMEAAKKDACLKAIEELHKLGALNDYLLPQKDDGNEEGSDSDCSSYEDDGSRGALHEMLVPAVLGDSWTNLENHVHLNSYYIRFTPDPEDRIYKKFGLFVKSPLPAEADRMELDLHLARGRSVMTKLVPTGIVEFNKDEIIQAQHFQEMFFKVILDRSEFIPEFVPLGKNFFDKSRLSTFYLLLPVFLHDYENKVTIDWKIVRRCLFSPVFRNPAVAMIKSKEIIPSGSHLQLANGCTSITDVENSLVYVTHKKEFYFITNIIQEKNAYSPSKDSGSSSHVEHIFQTFKIHLKHPKQPLLRAKPLFHLRNLLHNRKAEESGVHELDEFFMELPPELCQLKIIGFSKDIGSSLSLLPSIMHRLENLLVAIELKHMLSASFPEGAKVTAHRVLEALTTEKCQERFSLERLEILGDAFLKFAVGRYLFLLHATLDEGELTRKRSKAVENSNLFKLGSMRKLQVYIRDQPFDPCQFFALGRPCRINCSKENESTLHSQSHVADKSNDVDVRCSKGHHWLHKKTIADVVEALVGAFIVDSGFRAATAFLRWIGIPMDFEASQVTTVCIASKSYMPLTGNIDISSLENSLRYQFLHKGLLLQAFVHPSYNKQGGGCYQRLEFLGDAVLDYLITSYLFSVYPKLTPGQLTDLRSASVSNQAFANVAVDQSFHKFLICDSDNLSEAIKNYVDFVKSPSSEAGLFEGPKCPKALGDLVESCLGAILLDSGFDLNIVWKIMLSFLDPTKAFSILHLNPIRELRELCQSHNWVLQFPTSEKGGFFAVEAKVNGNDVCVSASASNVNKKDATNIAAKKAIAKLKVQGFVLKSKSLEEIVKSTCREEATLIGYDETPIDVAIPDAIGFENLKMQEPFVRNFSQKTHPINEATNICLPRIVDVNRQLSLQSETSKGQVSETVADPSGDMSSETTGGSQTKSARSRLYEICAANCWKPPLFECYKDEGPSHLKSYTFKVMLEIEEAPDASLECFGAPRNTKKAAAEHAAEGSLWYLEHEGYVR